MKFGSVKLVIGVPHCGWFNMFWDSTRISAR